MNPTSEPEQSYSLLEAVAVACAVVNERETHVSFMFYTAS